MYEEIAMSKKGCPACPEVEVDMSKVVAQVKREILSEAAEPAPTAEVNVMSFRLMPSSSDFSGNKFLLGYVTLPTVINLGAKLADAGVLFPQIDAVYVRGGAVLATAVTHVLTGGKSFLLGSLLGQLPMVMDDIANFAVEKIKSRQIVAPEVPAAAAPAVKGIGNVDAEVLKLRDELNRIQMNGLGDSYDDYDYASMEGVGNRASFH